MANLKHAFGGQQKDLVSPYVQVSFAGLTVSLNKPKNFSGWLSFLGLYKCQKELLQPRLEWADYFHRDVPTTVSKDQDTVKRQWQCKW